jgi:hypothetical protein
MPNLTDDIIYSSEEEKNILQQGITRSIYNHVEEKVVTNYDTDYSIVVGSTTIKFSNKTNPLYLQILKEIHRNVDYDKLHKEIENKRNSLHLNYFQGSSLCLDDSYDHIKKNIIVHLNYEDKFIYRANCRDLIVHNRDISLLIDEINYYKVFAEQKNKKFIILIDAVHEAPTYRYNFKKNLDLLSTKTDIPIKNFLIFSAACHQYNDLKYSYTPDIAFVKKIDDSYYSNLPKYHFVSLVRIPREHRIISTLEILNRKLDQYGNISFDSGYYHEPNTKVSNLFAHILPVEYKDYFCISYNEKYKNKFPLYIDGEIIGLDPKAINSIDEKITGAFVNFVQETSFDRSLALNVTECNTWSVPLISEKSIKPFVFGQVPIFVSHYENLKYLREFGFDLFDDIIDHSYDTELDPFKRIKLCVDQLEKICSWSLDDCQKFKQDNMHRFENNRNIFNVWHCNSQLITRYNLQKTLDSYDL